MSTPPYNYFQTIPALQFDPATLTGTFEPISMNGFTANINLMTLYNGGSVAIDVSFDGTNLAQVLPPGGTMIVDLQTNHNTTGSNAAGTLNGRAGQNVWVRTCENPTFLTVGGFR